MRGELLTIMLDASPDQFDADTDVVPDDPGSMPAPVPRFVEAAVRSAARRAGCTCGDALEVRSRILEDGPTGRRYLSPARLHLTGCPLLAGDGRVRVTVGTIRTEVTDA